MAFVLWAGAAPSLWGWFLVGDDFMVEHHAGTPSPASLIDRGAASSVCGVRPGTCRASPATRRPRRGPHLESLAPTGESTWKCRRSRPNRHDCV